MKPTDKVSSSASRLATRRTPGPRDDRPEVDAPICSPALLPRLLPQNKKAAPEENGRSESELEIGVSPLGLEPRTG